MAATIARMTACDGLPFVVFTTSLDLRKAMLALGFQLAKSENSVSQLVLDQGDRIRAMVISQLHIRKEQGQRFSLTFDDWTSTRNRRLHEHKRTQSRSTVLELGTSKSARINASRKM